MCKSSLAKSAGVFVILAITSTSLFGQSGRFRDARAMPNDLSRKEKNLVITSKVQSDSPAEIHTRDGAESAPVDRNRESAPTQTKPIQGQQLTDEDFVSIIIVAALVFIVFVGLRRM